MKRVAGVMGILFFVWLLAVSAVGLAEDSGPGVMVADLDLDRLPWLREGEQQRVIPKPYRATPGILKERRPPLYTDLVDSKAPARDFVTSEQVNPGPHL